MSRMKVILAGALLAAVAVVGAAGPAAAQEAVLECEMIFSDQVCAQVEGTAQDVFAIVERFDEPSEIAAYIQQQYDWLKCRIDPATCGW